MVEAVDFSGLHAWADAMGTILLLELCVLLLIVAVLMFVLALGARWLQMHVVPLLNATVPKARQALDVAQQSSDRVVHGVAEVYGVRRAIETATRILFFGKQGIPSERGQRVAEVPTPQPTGASAAPTVPTSGSPFTVTRPSPTERSTPAPAPEPREPREPRQPGQPYDNMAAHAS